MFILTFKQFLEQRLACFDPARHGGEIMTASEAELRSYVLCHQPKSFDWRLRKAKAHPLKSLSNSLFIQVCDRLNQIIQLA